MFGQLRGEIHRAMASTGAADGDRQVRLAFADEARQKEVDEAVQFALKCLHFAVSL